MALQECYRIAIVSLGALAQRPLSPAGFAAHDRLKPVVEKATDVHRAGLDLAAERQATAHPIELANHFTTSLSVDRDAPAALKPNARLPATVGPSSDRPFPV